MFKFRCLKTIIILIFLCFTGSVFGLEPPKPKRLNEAYASLLAEAEHLRKTCGDKIWEGWGSAVIPFVVITETHEYALNFPKKLDGFTSIGIDPILGTEVQVGNRTHAVNLGASFDFQGVEAVVVGAPDLLEKVGAAWILVVTHEAFHVYQSQHGRIEKIAETGFGKDYADGSWMLNYPFPYKDETIMGAIHLQGFPLYLAATDGDNGNAGYALGTSLDAINVYRKLLQLLTLDNRSYQYACIEEWVEGVALYTEYRMAKMAAEDGTYKPTNGFEKFKGAKSYLSAWDSDVSP